MKTGVILSVLAATIVAGCTGSSKVVVNNTASLPTIPSTAKRMIVINHPISGGEWAPLPSTVDPDGLVTYHAQIGDQASPDLLESLVRTRGGVEVIFDITDYETGIGVEAQKINWPCDRNGRFLVSARIVGNEEVWVSQLVVGDETSAGIAPEGWTRVNVTTIANGYAPGPNYPLTNIAGAMCFVNTGSSNYSTFMLTQDSITPQRFYGVSFVPDGVWDFTFGAYTYEMDESYEPIYRWWAWKDEIYCSGGLKEITVVMSQPNVY